MLKQSELLELTDEDLLDLVGKNIVIRLALRSPTEPVVDEDGNEVEDGHPFRRVTAAGKLIELQFSADTGGSIAYIYSGSPQPDELRWDSDEYRADFIWEYKE